MIIKPFFPSNNFVGIFAISSDEPHLFYSPGTLTEKHAKEENLSLDISGVFQVASMLCASGESQVALYSKYKESPWNKVLKQYLKIFSKLGYLFSNKNNIVYFDRKCFYQSLGAHASKTKIENIAVSMLSYSNKELHSCDDDLIITQKAASKIELANNAEHYKIPIPETIACKKHDLDKEFVRNFFAKNQGRVVIKIMGLGSSNNVKNVSSVNDCLNFLKHFDGSLELILQERLDLNLYKEMAVDIVSNDKGYEIKNLREILHKDGMYAGNLYSASFELKDNYRQALDSVVSYVYSLGNLFANNCTFGVDFYVKQDEVLIGEINARWTGGLLIGMIIDNFNIRQDVYSYFSLVSIENISNYLDFNKEYLYSGEIDKEFSLIPMGFSPYVQLDNGAAKIFVWQAVIGDIDNFIIQKNKFLGEFDLCLPDNCVNSI